MLKKKTLRVSADVPSDTLRVFPAALSGDKAGLSPFVPPADERIFPRNDFRASFDPLYFVAVANSTPIYCIVSRFQQEEKVETLLTLPVC
jgi:hypothetical protein